VRSLCGGGRLTVMLNVGFCHNIEETNKFDEYISNWPSVPCSCAIRTVSPLSKVFTGYHSNSSKDCVCQ